MATRAGDPSSGGNHRKSMARSVEEQNHGGPNGSSTFS